MGRQDMFVPWCETKAGRKEGWAPRAAYLASLFCITSNFCSHTTILHHTAHNTGLQSKGAYPESGGGKEIRCCASEQ